MFKAVFAGVTGLQMTLWSRLWAPNGTPKHIVATLNVAALEALSEAQVRKQLENLGLQMPSADRLTPQAVGAWPKAEVEKWWPLIKAAHVSVD